MPFRVHHYVGSWETFRQPGYDARGKSLFDRRNKGKKWFDETTPRFSSKENSTWLKQFAKLVGTEKALALTQTARIREELNMEQLFQKLDLGNQELEWERINKRKARVTPISIKSDRTSLQQLIGKLWNHFFGE